MAIFNSKLLVYQRYPRWTVTWTKIDHQAVGAPVPVASSTTQQGNWGMSALYLDGPRFATRYPLVIFDIAIEHGWFIVDLPITTDDC